jgi:mRNA interferase MazF
MTARRNSEVWWAEMPDKRRPVLVLTREAAIPVLRTVLVAPITRKRRDIPTEVTLDVDDGMPSPCAVALDNCTVANKAYLVERLTRLSAARMAAVCQALGVATDCLGRSGLAGGPRS